MGKGNLAEHLWAEVKVFTVQGSTRAFACQRDSKYSKLESGLMGMPPVHMDRGQKDIFFE